MLVPLEEKLDVLWGFVRTHLQAKTLVFFSSCKQVTYMRYICMYKLYIIDLQTGLRV